MGREGRWDREESLGGDSGSSSMGGKGEQQGEELGLGCPGTSFSL